MSSEPTVIQGYSAHVGYRADRYRYEPRVRLLVETIPVSHVVGDGIPVPGGEPCYVDVPASMVDVYKDQVVEEWRLDRARDEVKRRTDEWCEQYLRETGHTDRTNALKRCPVTLAGTYRVLFGEDMPPFRKLEVVDEDVPPPISPEEQKAVAIARYAHAGEAKASGGTRRRGRRKSGASE